MAYYVDGKQVRGSCGPDVKTLTQAQKALRDAMRAADFGLTPSNATVDDLLELYLEDQRRMQRKALYDAEKRVGKMRAALGHLQVTEVSTRHLERFSKGLNVKGATINRYRAVWTRAFTLANEVGMNLKAPHWPRYQESAPKRDYVSRKLFDKVLACLKQPYRAFVTAAYWTACRRGEVMVWRWDYIDLDKRLVLLPDTKGGRPRVVPLAEEAWKEVLLLSLKRESEWPSSPWVFTLDGEKPVSKSAIRDAWERARDLAGLPGLRLHALRHTAITNMRSAGVEEGTAMAISGHRTRSVFDRYGIQPENTLIEAVRRMELAEKSAQNTRSLLREKEEGTVKTLPN